MTELNIAFFGDVVGSPGRDALRHAATHARLHRNAHYVFANAENAKHGSGLSADLYRELRKPLSHHHTTLPGPDALTLGDHGLRDRSIYTILDDPHEPVSRPANLSSTSPGKRIIRIPPHSLSPARASSTAPGAPGSFADIPAHPPIYIITLLGRLYMPIPADSPFAALDRELAAIPDPDALVIVEIHAEATSEKLALTWHALERWTAGATDAAGGESRGGPAVVAVLGSHTHVQTADARVIDQRLAAITDLGMTGPHRGVIGRSTPHVLQAMIDQLPVTLDVASDDARAQGVMLRIDPARRRAISCTPLDIPLPG